MSFFDFDRQMMEIALGLARRGLGTTAPNPSVGAVIADPETGELISRGVTQPGGRPHAETQALARAGARARGATLYVTLEPCAHHGKTPPCADAVIAAGIRRVVIGIEDPDPRVRGDGIARLSGAGVAVEVGVCAEAARWVTLGHILRVTERRPFVQLKMALGSDGEVPRGAGGQARIVTGPEALGAAHGLRAEADAILVGAGTARDDNPALTCRLPGLSARSPIRVVLSRDLELSTDLRLVATAREVPTWFFAGEGADEKRVQAFETAGVRVFRNSPPPSWRGHAPHGLGEGLGVGGTPTANVLDPPPPSLPHKGGGTAAVRDVLARLADEGVTRLLVEGGPAVWRAFAAEGLVDEVVLFQAGAARMADFRPADLAARFAPGLDLALTASRTVGADRMSVLRVRHREVDGS